MKHFTALILGAAASLCLAGNTYADECSDLQLCIDTSVAACITLAGNPVCDTPPVSLAELRSAITNQCGCGVVVTEGLPDECVCPGNESPNKKEHVTNFGKFRSCVAAVTNALRETGMIDAATKTAMKGDNTLCKAVIKAERQANKGGKGKGPK